MTGNGLTDIVLPIVIAICLVTWLSMVFWANAHPHRGRYSTDLRSEVRGGSFQAMEGGRQLMPIPEHRPAVPGQRAAAGSETYQAPGGATATATATSTADYDESAEEDTTPMATRPRRRLGAVTSEAEWLRPVAGRGHQRGGVAQARRRPRTPSSWARTGR